MKERRAHEPAAEESAPASFEPSRAASGITFRHPDKPPIGEAERERETTPAPPSSTAVEMSEPSFFPTTIPELDVSVSGAALLRADGTARIPMDVAVPVRTTKRAPEDLPHRLAFLLLVVDGRSSIADIATANGLPIEDVLASFVDLMGAGLVGLGGATSAGVPTSRASSPDLAPSDDDDA